MAEHPFSGTDPGKAKKVIPATDGTGFSEGTGNPCILQHPDGSTKILFTGWTTFDGSGRDLFVADIDPTLNTGDIADSATKIVNASDLGGQIDGAYGFYDPVSEEWILGYGYGVGSAVGVMTLSKDLSTLKSTTEFNTADVRDSGAVAFANNAGDLLLSYVTENDNLNIKKVQNDHTNRPISGTLSEINAPIQGAPYRYPDVHQIMRGVGGLTILFEDYSADKTHWTLHPAFTGNVDVLERSVVALQSTKPLLQSSMMSRGDDYGHPYHTTALGRPLLFFAHFKDLGSGSFEHEIWAMEPEYNVLTPEDWLPLRGRVLISGASGPSDPWMTHDASKCVIMLNTTNTGEFNIREAPSAGMLNSGVSTERTETISSTGRHKFVVDDPMYAMEVEADFATDGIDVMLR